MRKRMPASRGVDREHLADIGDDPGEHSARPLVAAHPIGAEHRAARCGGSAPTPRSPKAAGRRAPARCRRRARSGCGRASPRRPDRLRGSARATRAPPSTSSRVMPSSASRVRQAARSRPPAPRADARTGAAAGAHLRRSPSRAEHPGRRARRRRHWRSCAEPAVAVEHDADRRARLRGPGSRQVSAGSSASTVPRPTRIASKRERSAWTCRRAISPVTATCASPAPSDRVVGGDGELQDHMRPPALRRG